MFVIGSVIIMSKIMQISERCINKENKSFAFCVDKLCCQMIYSWWKQNAMSLHEYMSRVPQ